MFLKPGRAFFFGYLTKAIDNLHLIQTCSIVFSGFSFRFFLVLPYQIDLDMCTISHTKHGFLATFAAAEPHLLSFVQ